jgi:hypothetical protein
MEQSPPSEADSRLAGQEILDISWNSKGHYHVYKTIRHWTLSCASWIQLTHPQPIFLRLFSNPRPEENLTEWVREQR